MSNVKHVPALTRAHALFLNLLKSPWPMGISDLSRELNLGKSTVHGLVHTMTHLGLIEREPESNRRFQPARVVLDLWRRSMVEGSLSRAAKPLLSVFSERNNLTALAGVYLHSRVLIVEAVLAPGFSISAYQGQTIPVWAGALGKLLSASLPPGRSRRLAKSFSERVSTSAREYLLEVERTRESGVALDREEYIPGVRALAALVPPSGPLAPLGAVWAVGLAPSLDERRLKELGPELKSLAEEIDRRAREMEKGRQ